MSGLGGVTRGVAVVNSASSASGSDAEDASPSGTRGASGGNRSKKEALRLAGEAYFDRVLSEAGGKAGFGANKMSSAAGGAAGKSGGGAGVSTGYALGLGESANRKGGGSSHKGNTDDPIMDDEDQAALDAIEQTIERSKAFLLLFMHIMASGLSLICFTHAMPMTKSTWSTMFLHFMGNVIGMSLLSSLGVLRPENELNYDVRRMRAAIVPGTMHFLMTYTLFSWYRRNYETYALALWCGVSQWVPFVLKKLLIGDVPRNEPTSHTEYKNYVENGDEDPLLSGAEEAGKVDHPNGSSSSSGENGAAMSLGDDHVPSSGRNYAHWILKHLFGVVIRRPHIASFEEMWALRVISACFVGMWAENKTLGSVGEPHLWERPLTFIATYFAMDLFFQLHETRKEIGRPLYITRLIEGNKPVILNDIEKIFYSCLIGVPLVAAAGLYQDYTFFTYYEQTMPVVQMHMMLLGCVLVANMTYLAVKPLVNKDVWAPVIGLSGTFALVTYYYALSDARQWLVSAMMVAMSFAWGYLVGHDKRSFYPGTSIIQT